MSLKNSKTTCSYLNWSELTKLILKLERDGETKFALLISVGAFTGLRASDILSLSWSDLVGKDILELHEKKTSKFRRIKLNSDLTELVERIYNKIGQPSLDEKIFINKYGTKAINIQWVNVKLKEIFIKYGIKSQCTSTHLLRKSFGRQIWTLNNYSDMSLIMLSEIFNHSNIQITKRYLGIREEEIFDVYDSLSF